VKASMMSRSRRTKLFRGGAGAVMAGLPLMVVSFRFRRPERDASDAARQLERDATSGQGASSSADDTGPSRSQEADHRARPATSRSSCSADARVELALPPRRHPPSAASRGLPAGAEPRGTASSRSSAGRRRARRAREEGPGPPGVRGPVRGGRRAGRGRPDGPVSPPRDR
jgi:hypothetical protein